MALEIACSHSNGKPLESFKHERGMTSDSVSEIVLWLLCGEEPGWEGRGAHREETGLT